MPIMITYFWRSPVHATRLLRLVRCPTARRLHPSHHEYEDFGNYRVILPPEPFVWGTSHIQSRPVPREIRRPVYIINGSKENDPDHGDPHEGDGLIPLGGHEERCLREAAILAKEVREHVRSIMRVRALCTFFLNLESLDLC
jgi:hypothetical protein